VSRVGTVVALALRLLQLGGHRAWTAAGLVGAGVAVGTTLLAVTLGALHGWDAREARTGWRGGDPVPAVAGTPPVAALRVATDVAAGRPLHLVDVVDPRPGVAPPPGLPRMPAPGEVWISPALARLLRELPADRLAARFPGPPAGEMGATGLVSADELVAVVGRAGPVAGAVPVTALAPDPGEFTQLEVYRQLTYVAVVLLAFPVLSLLGSSARLSTVRRTERLATLRLLGASTAQVTGAAVTEVVAVAAVAAVAGIALEWLIAPLLAGIPLAGSGWFTDDLRPSLPVAALTVVAVTLLGLASAIGGMRQVVVSPLGVARRSRPGTARLVRALALVAGIAVFVVANRARGAAGRDVAGLVFGVGLLALFGTVMLIGPLVVRRIGASLARSARSPAKLLAGRRILDDPRGAFRPVAGLTLAVFVAGFLAPLTSVVGGSSGDDTALRLRPDGQAPAAVAQQADATLRAAGIGARVTSDRLGALVVAGTGTDRDRVRTALGPVAAGTPVVTAREARQDAATLGADLTTGATIVLVGTFLVAATSTGTAAAARVLDQRRTLRLLCLAGTPLAVLDAARRAETFRPLLVNGAIALALGLLCASPFAAAEGLVAPSSLLLLGGTLVAGLVLVAAASAASRPLLRTVTGGAPRDDG
jgi:FtsX-like permease family